MEMVCEDHVEVICTAWARPHLHTVLYGSCFSHLLAELVVADASHVRGSTRHLQHPLCHADAVLRCPSSNVLDVGLISKLLRDIA